MNKMLGKLAPRDDSRTLKLSNYILRDWLPPIPDCAAWCVAYEPSKWGMMGNDRYGDCVFATAAHIVMCARANESGIIAPIPDDEVIATAAALNGLDGYVVLDRLKYWRKHLMFGSKIEAFCQVDINDMLMRTAIYIFGHLDIGLAMPRAWQNTSFWGAGDGSDFESNSWGGHSVPLLGYTAHSEMDIVYYACSWGNIVTITQETLKAYCDEAYVSILPDWYAADRITPSGFDYRTLQEDLVNIA